MRNLNGGGIFVLKTGLVFTVTPFCVSVVPFQQKLSESKTLFQIENLKESTLYCFSIQVQLKIYSGHFLEGQQSAPQCHRTALSGMERECCFWMEWDGVGHESWIT